MLALLLPLALPMLMPLVLLICCSYLPQATARVDVVVVVSSLEAAIVKILVLEAWCAALKIHKFRV